MDITEVRHRFAAYGSGELTQSQLRDIIRSALTREPSLSTAYIALSEAYRRAQVIDAELHAVIVADIREITGPRLVPKVSTDSPLLDAANEHIVAPEADAPTSITEADADSPAPAGGAVVESYTGTAVTSSMGPVTNTGANTGYPGTGHPDISNTGTGHTGTGRTGTGTGTGSAWDSPERLAEAAEPLFAGSILNGRFQLVEELGRGGMGVVYKALDLQTAALEDRQRHVAIKVLNDDFKRHPLAVRSLQREARKAQKLAHPNIVTVHDFDRDGGNVYMELELLTGRSLDQVLRTEAKGGLPAPRVMEIVGALGAALGYAHEQGIVHSDFKPSNAFITDAGVVKVLDFGIARAAPTRAADRGDKTIFDAGQLGAISPAYASLEMLNGEEPDVRDDVYALACVTYQLLTGRHPFNRIDAAKAREAGLQPARVRSLTFSQWRALREGLAFERAARVPTVAEFVSRFSEPPRRSMWLAIAASIVVIAIASTIVVRHQLVAHRATALQAELATTDPARYAVALQSLRAAPENLRERVLLEEATRTAVLGHFKSGIQEAIAAPGYDYARARALAADLQKLLPDSSLVVTTVQQLERDRQAELARQLVSRDKYLHEGPFVPSQDPGNLTATLRIIQRIDPQNNALSDPRLPVAYGTAAATAADTGRADLGKEIVDAGLEFAPSDAKLVALQDRIAAQVQRETDARRAVELEQRLSALSPTAPGFLDAVLASRDDVSALATVAPSSPTLTRIQAGLQTTVLQRIKQQLADHDIAAARDLLLNVGELLPEQTLAAARAEVLNASGVEEDRALDTLDRLRNAALTGRLEQKGASSAVDLYAELQRAGAGPNILAEARDLLAYGYLRQARRAWALNDAESASKALATGRALQAGPTLQQRLTAEEAIVKAGPVSGNGPSRNAIADLNAARAHFEQTLLASNLGLQELAVTAEALDRLEALGATPKEADAGLQEIEARVIDEVDRLQQQSQMDRAQLFAQQASATVLGSSRIAEIARQLRHTTSRAEARSSPESLAERNALSDLIAKPEATQRWATAVHKEILTLTPVVTPNDPGLVDARHVAVVTFVNAASEARAGKNEKQAKEFLDTARTFDPQAAEITRENAVIERDRSAAESQASDHARQASIDSLKSQLASQVAAADMTGANATAGTLRQVLGGSVYVAREMPQLLVEGYVHQARTQLAAGHVDEALDSLAAARKKFGTAPELKNLESRYVAIGDIFDRLRTAVALNADDLRHSLDGLRVAEGTEYAAVETMLAHTLANRIADQRAANRASVVASLLEAGHKIFPDSAAALEHGTAGVLPKSGVAITEP